MIGRPGTSELTVVFALRFGDREIVDAGVAFALEVVFVEFPILVTVGAIPVAGVVVRLVREATAIRLPSNAQSSLMSR
jgi:hypothetical protein